MGYSIYVTEKDGSHVDLPERHEIGGTTYAVGGTYSAWISITCNYWPFFQEYLDQTDGIHILYGKTLQEADPILQSAIEHMQDDYPEVLGDDPPGSDDIWLNTPYNAWTALRKIQRIGQLAMEAYPDKTMLWSGC